MPFVTIKLTREGTVPGADRTTPGQKAQIYEGITALFEDVLGKHPQDTWIVFQEVDLDDWGRGGLSVPHYRQNQSKT